MDLFYHPSLTLLDKQIELDAEESKHLTKVLRKKRGDKLMITNGKGLRAPATIIEIASKKK